MVLAAKTPIKKAELVRKIIQEKNLTNPDYTVKKDTNFIYFPIKRRIKIKNTTIVNTKLQTKKTVDTIQDKLKKILTKKEQSILLRSFDVIGDIIILELPGELIKKEKKIAQIYLNYYKNVKTVLKKSNIHSGIYRTRKLKILAGKQKKETLYTESGIRLKIHLEKMYFSSRFGTERLRTAKLTKPKEDVLVLFSGCAPFPCVIAKHSQAKHISGIEINPHAHKYAKENIKLNKLEDRITLYRGDVRKVLPTLKKFDRIVMPLPKTGEEFLPLVLKHIKKNGAIHYYAFLEETQFLAEKTKIKKICKTAKKSCKILRITKAGQHAPYVFRVVFDIKVSTR
jgi:tRNA (guanine37-N1)-methyltransferase